MSSAVEMDTGSSSDRPVAPNASSILLATLSRGTGVLAGCVGIISGLVSLLSISPKCIFAGFLLILESLCVTLIEAPFLCVFLDFGGVPTEFFDGKPYYVRAALYLIFSVLPMTFCSGFFLLMGCVFMLISSAFYLMRAIGPKASRQEMASNAANVFPVSSGILSLQGDFTTETKIPMKESGLTGELPPPYQ